MTGLEIRQFLRELFGSRLNAHMEDELFRLRGDYDTRLQEREARIAELKEQVLHLAEKIDRYEAIFLPKFFGPKKEQVPLEPFETEESWAAFKEREEARIAEEWDAQQKK